MIAVNLNAILYYLMHAILYYLMQDVFILKTNARWCLQ